MESPLPAKVTAKEKRPSVETKKPPYKASFAARAPSVLKAIEFMSSA
jgi:hypothetical protein